MRNVVAVLLTVGFLVSCVFSQKDLNMNPFAKTKDSIYKINAYGGGSCSAFTLTHKKKLYMITAGHCCNGLEQDDVTWASYPDICVVKAKKTVKDLKTLKLSNKEPKVGDRVFTTGFPKGIGPLSYEGFINTITPYEYVISIHFLPGQSGSALVNAEGDVISLGSMYYTWIEGGMIGPSLPELKKFLDMVDKKK